MLRALALTILLPVAIVGTASDFAGPNQFICGTATVMQADPLGPGESGFWTLIQGSATFGNSISPTSLVTDLSFGENILQWTLIAPGGATPDQVSIFCYDSAMPFANAGPDQVVFAPPSTATMDADPPIAPAICFWTVIAGTGTITDVNDPNTTVVGLGIGQNVFQWSCDNGPCGISSDVIIVEATEAIGIADERASENAPYYDPFNQRLVFAQQSPSMSITLFDQQGRVVEQLSAPTGAGVWDLSAMPSGIYVAQVATLEGSSTLRFVVQQ